VEYVPEGSLGSDRGDGFLHGEVLTTRGLIRYFVLFVIDLKRAESRSQASAISPAMIG